MTAQLAIAPLAPLLTAFVVGLLGGVHCLAMCGGIVSALSLSGKGKRLGVWRQLAYSAGRITSYTAAGAIAGFAGSVGGWIAHVLPAQTALYVLANALVVFLGLYLAGWGTAILRVEAAGHAVWRRVAPLGRIFTPAASWPRAFTVGMLWGWIPCGMTYSMIGLALLGGDSVHGAALMLAFGLGTLPNLLLAGMLLDRLRKLASDRRVRVAAGVLVAGFGIAGLVRAAHLEEHIRHGLLYIT